ncbi:hypothetical protein [Terrabacter sp. NPDC080008]|uniref:hypothetical protein n=1 Tax=Terrabacter sp. NPDC080008 TaxID=3155176 RepID=UPI00344EEBA0
MSHLPSHVSAEPVGSLVGAPVAAAGEREESRRRTTHPMRIAAGAALVAGPVLWALGLVTSPPQDSMADADYIASLTRDTTMTQVSALFLHYGNLVIALGILAAPSLVRGARGRVVTVVGALLAALGFANMSGMVLSDWWNASAGTLLSSDQAVAVFQGFKQGSLLGFWDGTEPLNLLGPVLVLVGLARAGVLGWWSLLLLVGGVAGLMVFGATTPLVAAATVLVGFSPFALIGRRLLQRRHLAA